AVLQALIRAAAGRAFAGRRRPTQQTGGGRRERSGARPRPCPPGAVRGGARIRPPRVSDGRCGGAAGRASTDMARLFGTDGVRGEANSTLTADLALAPAEAAASVLAAPSAGSARPVAVVGRDPRASGEMLQAAVCAGLAASGVDVLRVGVVPTPAVAYLTAAYEADMGVMISASHNPMPDNGI